MAPRFQTVARFLTITLVMVSSLYAQQPVQEPARLLKAPAATLLPPVAIPLPPVHGNAVGTTSTQPAGVATGAIDYGPLASPDAVAAESASRPSRLPADRKNRLSVAASPTTPEIQPALELPQSSALPLVSSTVAEEPVGRATLNELTAPTSRLSGRLTTSIAATEATVEKSHTQDATEPRWVPARLSSSPDDPSGTSDLFDILPTHVEHSNAAKVAVSSFSLPPLPPRLEEDSLQIEVTGQTQIATLVISEVLDPSTTISLPLEMPAAEGTIDPLDIASSATRSGTDIPPEVLSFPENILDSNPSNELTVNNLPPASIASSSESLSFIDDTAITLLAETTPEPVKLSDKQRERLDRLHRTLHSSVNNVSLTKGMKPAELPDNLAATLRPSMEPQWVFESGWVNQPPVRYTHPFVHRPLYFEDHALERCGHTIGVSQPLVSAVHFLGNVVFLPFHMVCEDPYSTYLNSGDCKSCQ
ncbi:MAG: hypothetical protein R3C01_11835 [Planctomycetaceae bacterium]